MSEGKKSTKTNKSARKQQVNKSKDSATQKQNKAKSRTVQDDEIARILVTGEEVVLRAQLHNAIYWKSIAVLIVAIIVWLLAPPLGVILSIAGVIMLCLAILTQHFLILAVTNKRVIARYGLLQMDVVDIRLSKIESIDLERMLPGHMFGYASVVVAGTGQRILRVPYIGNADDFRKFYNEMVLAEEGSDEADEAVAHALEKEAKARTEKPAS